MTAGAGTGLVATAVTPIDTAAQIEGETPPRATTGGRRSDHPVQAPFRART